MKTTPNTIESWEENILFSKSTKTKSMKPEKEKNAKMEKSSQNLNIIDFI